MSKLYPRRIILVLKKSPYQIYFLERKNRLFLRRRAGEEDVERMKQAHEEHLRTCEVVEHEVRKTGLGWRSVYRADLFTCRPDEIVITVGGDGTFLEASHRLRHQWILGVNSDPARSVGHYCAADRSTFITFLQVLLEGRAPLRRLNRIELELNGKRLESLVLNEILVCHVIPAAMSRYRLRIGRATEEQRCSGLWLSTAAGSTAAILSAGGKEMGAGSRKLQYLPRELFIPPGKSYVHRGGMISEGKHVEIVSMMRDGRIYIDGSHLKIDFPYGDRLRVRNSRYPLQAVVQKS